MRYLALGQDVIVVLDGRAYYFGPEGETRAVAEPQSVDKAIEQVLNLLKGFVNY